MMKLVGSLLILTGGGLLRRARLRADRRRRRALTDLASALNAMCEEVRMARTPMPELLRRQAEGCGVDVGAFLRSAAAASAGEEGLAGGWARGVPDLPLDEPERELLLGLDLRGDEEQVCGALSRVGLWLSRRAEEKERNRLEVTKRTTALCFSGAVLLVILLI